MLGVLLGKMAQVLRIAHLALARRVATRKGKGKSRPGYAAKNFCLSGMEEVVLQMRQQLSEIREEETVLRQMLQVLNKVLLNYINCEGRVVNELEADDYLYVSRSIGSFRIPENNGLIR